MSYGDYVEQLTYLLFLKMADERTKAPYNQKYPVPEKYSWPSLIKKNGDELFDHYRHTLEALGNQKGLLGLIFNKTQNKELVKCYNAENRHNRKPTWSEKRYSGSEAGMTAKGKKKKSSPHPSPFPEGEGTGSNGRWRAYTYDEIAARDKVSLDIFWLRDDTLEDSNNLPAPDVLAAEIVADLEAALEQFREIATDLTAGKEETTWPSWRD